MAIGLIQKLAAKLQQTQLIVSTLQELREIAHKISVSLYLSLSLSSEHQLYLTLLKDSLTVHERKHIN